MLGSEMDFALTKKKKSKKKLKYFYEYEIEMSAYFSSRLHSLNDKPVNVHIIVGIKEYESGIPSK